MQDFPSAIKPMLVAPLYHISDLICIVSRSVCPNEICASPLGGLGGPLVLSTQFITALKYQGLR